MKAVANINHSQEAVPALNRKDTLLLAIGNSARSDDGLGWAFAEKLKAAAGFKGVVNLCYQLQVEDAELISGFPSIVFVDACTNALPGGFGWEECRAQNDVTFTTHALTPEAVLFLCNELYQQFPRAYTLKIKGIDWELKTGLSKQAGKHLDDAFRFFNEQILYKEKAVSGHATEV